MFRSSLKYVIKWTLTNLIVNIYSPGSASKGHGGFAVDGRGDDPSEQDGAVL